MRFVFSFLIIAITTNETILAQAPSYKRMMYDNTKNFYEVCDSAETYFANRDKGKGSGYKQYLRWKNYNEHFYYPTGNRQVDHILAQKEFNRILRESSNSLSYKLFQNGGWQNLGPDTIRKITGHYAAGLGRVEYVEVNPNNANQIYMGSRSGGLWRTSNGGLTWTQNTDYLPASGVNAITVNPSNFDSVLINVRIADNGTSFGIYQSSDGGLNFTPTNFTPSNLGNGGLGSNFQIFIMKYHPRVPNLIFIGTSKGVYRSDNNLQTWTQLYPLADITDINFHPTNNDIIYIHDSYVAGNKNSILKSTDRGLSYTNTPNLPGNNNAKLKISVSSICPDCIFVSSDNGIWKSYNAGSSFVTTLSPAPAGVSLWHAKQNDIDTTKVVGGYVDLFRSTTGGRTFAQATSWSLGTNNGSGNFQQNYDSSPNYVHADCNYMTCVNGVFYACTDGFLCKSNDNGISWQKISLNTGIRENYRVGVSQSNHYSNICGSQDNGTSILVEDGWIEAYGADGMEGIIHPLNDKWMIGSTQNGGRRRTINAGESTDGVTPPGQSASWIAPMLYDPNNHMSIFSFGTKVYKSVDFGETWDSLGSPSSFTGTISRAAIAENNTKLIAISRNEFIDLSTNGGVSFSSIKSNLPNRAIEFIAFDPKKDSTILVCYSNYETNNQKIYISFNLGQTWNNITHNLGSMPINTIAVDHTDSSTIYVGCAIGVYKKSMTGNSWALYNPNLPNVSINDLEINRGSNTIRAATWGRGLWEYSLAGRNNYPAVIKTTINDIPTYSKPKYTIQQFVSAEITYSSNLTSVYTLWAVDSPKFLNQNALPMSFNQNIWKTNSPLPLANVGSKIYFKVIAVGSSNDTTETYKFMYEIKPYEYCDASGTTNNGNLFINRFRCANVDNSSNNTTNTTYHNLPLKLYRDSTYTAIGNFNTGWNENDFYVWIDYNGDREYDETELVVYQPNTSSTGSAAFTVPNNTNLNDTVYMRVRLGYWSSDANPCGTTLGEVENYPVVIHEFPRVQFSNDSIYCKGQNTSYTYIGSSADSLQWTISNGINTYVYTDSVLDFNNIPNGTYNLSLILFKKGEQYLFNPKHNLYLDNQPTAFAGNDTTICESEPITLMGFGNGTISWNNGLNNGELISPSVTTSYFLKSSSSLQCTAFDTLKVNVVSLSNLISVNTTNKYLFVNEDSAQYQWFDCSSRNIIADSTNRSFHPTLPGLYAAIIYKNGCIDTTECQQLFLSVSAIDKNTFTVYPNPTNGIVYLDFINPNSRVIELFDINGKLVKSKTSIEENNTSLSINEFSAGVYLLRITSSDESNAVLLMKK